MATEPTVLAQFESAQIACMTNAPLRRHTTFKIGGEADYLCEPKTEDEVAAALRIARENDLRPFVLGQGSNVLFCDEGYRGAVIHLGSALGRIAVAGEVVTAGAGARLMDVCTAARDAGLAGLEFAYGIPGSVGGAVFMNAGAFEHELSEVLTSVTCLDENLGRVTMPAEALGLAYRASIFQAQPWCILSATFCLGRGNVDEIDALMRQHLQIRNKKQPVELPSAGSAFKRPPGAFAAELIDRCGLRGYRMGNAAVSEKHCGFIVNLGGATCRDVLALADHVAKTVRASTGFVLEKEIRVIT